MLIDRAKERAKSWIVRLHEKLGINEFKEETESGEPDEDYMEPFQGVTGLKHIMSMYLMKLVMSAWLEVFS